MVLITIEEHWNLPELTSAVKALPLGRRDDSVVFDEMGDNLQRLDDITDARVAGMDAQGVDLQVLSLAPPGTQPLDPADAVALSRQANDVAAAAVARHPTRLRAFATLPLPDPDGAVAELHRAAGLGFVGAMVYGRTGDTPLDDPRHDGLFAAAAELGQPIFIHPQIPTGTVRRASYSGFDPATDLALATFGWGWHLEAALAALRLIVAGTFDRHPRLQLILGHWGELLLFWTDRADSLSRAAGLDRKVSEYLRSNVHITTSGMLNPTLLRHALDVTTADRLLFSTDYPFQRPTATDIAQFLTAFPTDQDRDKFTAGNARALFKLAVTPTAAGIELDSQPSSLGPAITYAIGQRTVTWRPTPGTQDAVQFEQVSGEVVLWRVFGLSDVLTDRPAPSWEIAADRGPEMTDQLRLSIGGIDENLRRAMIEWRAQLPIVSRTSRGEHLTYGQIDETYKKVREIWEAEPLVPFADPYPLWFTIRLSRPTTQRVAKGVLPMCFAGGPAATIEAVEAFEAEGNRYLDSILAHLLGSLNPLTVGALRVPGRQAFLLAPAHAAWRTPKFEVMTKDWGHVDRGAAWNETVPVEKLEAALQAFPRGRQWAKFGSQTLNAVRLFSSARAMSEVSDSMERFVYSFTGLEVLATQVERSSRDDFLRRLAVLDADTPFRELLWPAKSGDWVERNVVFRFSVMAALHTPTTAVADTAEFKKLAKTRNSLVHTYESPGTLRSQGFECTELLHRYLGLVAASEAGLGIETTDF